ncbi:MAG: DUF4157 domain-containing protein [Burkholderiaceae bacterium]|nr:DUF4157 domain-containing protein [Burkholderiaceae bacterium]
MKEAMSTSQASRATSGRARSTARAGSNAAAMAAPACGIDWADRRAAAAGPAAQPLPRRDGGLPERLKSGIESLSGLAMDAVRVHYNSPRPAQIGALAFTQGRDIHLAPAQERHLPHEAWHVVQQAQGRVATTRQMKGGVALNDARGLEREADLMGERALAAVAPTTEGAAPAGDAVERLGQLPNPVQRYTEEQQPEDGPDGNVWRVSDDEQAMLEISQAEGGQKLLATDKGVDAANDKLKNAGQKGSFVRLVASKQAYDVGGRSLKQVLPTYVDATGTESFNQEMASANKSGGADSTGDTQAWFKMYADCGRSSRTVMGSLGIAPKALYGVGTKDKETKRAFNPAEWTDLVYLEAMKGFVKDPANRQYLKKEHLKKRFGAYFRSEANKYEPKVPASGKEAKEFAGLLDDDGQQAFAEYAKIDAAVNPEIGEGYTMATGYDLTGFTGGEKAWNFHWAGVVMKAGTDNITLENYAVMFPATGDKVKDAENRQKAYDYTNTDWVFQMYGTVKSEQTFHEEHLRSGTHGTRGTTFRVKI